MQKLSVLYTAAAISMAIVSPLNAQVGSAPVEKIGISLEVREVTDAYTPIQSIAKLVPLSARPGWGKDYGDPYTFFDPLFAGSHILCEGNSNYSVVGLTQEKLDELAADGCDTAPVEDALANVKTPIESVDEDIATCIETVDDDERLTCWADLDKRLMEEIVPWIPYLDATSIYATSSAVTHYEFDQFPGTPAWSRLAVDPAAQQ